MIAERTAAAAANQIAREIRILASLYQGEAAPPARVGVQISWVSFCAFALCVLCRCIGGCELRVPRPLATVVLTARRQERINLPTVRQSDDGNPRPTCDSLRLNQGMVDSVEIPDEAQDLGQATNSMLVAGLKNSRDCAPGAEEFWAVEPDHKSCARQADIEGYLREVAVADPRLTGVRFLHQGAESGDVVFSPLRLPD